MRIIVVSIVLLIISACSSGPSYRKAKSSLPVLDKDKVRLIVYRTTDSQTFVARDAPISINGRKIGGVRYGGFTYSDVSIGEYIMSTSLWDSPGKCEIAFTINQTNKTFFFEVKPREEANEAFQKGSIIIFPLITGMAALASESKGKPCGGLFSITPVVPEKALKRLEG